MGWQRGHITCERSTGQMVRDLTGVEYQTSDFPSHGSTEPRLFGTGGKLIHVRKGTNEWWLPVHKVLEIQVVKEEENG